MYLFLNLNVLFILLSVKSVPQVGNVGILRYLMHMFIFISAVEVLLFVRASVSVVGLVSRHTHNNYPALKAFISSS